MVCSMCGMCGLDNPYVAHIRTRSEPPENQVAKQVTVASSMAPYERFDQLYSMNFNEHETLNAICKEVSGDEIIEISDNVASNF